MSKRKYISYWILSFVIGLFIFPPILDWLGVPFSFATVLYWVFGEPNAVNRVIVLILTGILVILLGRSLYKGYKKLA